MSHQLPESLRHLAVPIASLRPYPNNPRQGDIGAISQSLSAHNQYRPVVVRRADNAVLAGNHTLAAATALGWHEIAATFVDVDDDEAARIVIVDNRTSDLASNDPEKLAALLQELAATPAGLEGSGYDGDALDELLADLGQTGPELRGDPDAVPDAPEEAVSRRGDLWLLGRHRLLCGDATCAEDVGRLMDGGTADLLWTDPPYGVAYIGKTKDALTLRNDDATGLARLLSGALAQAQRVLRDGAAFYLAHPPGALGLVFWQAVHDLGWRIHEGLVWVKDSMVLGHADYHYKHEPILFGYLPGDGRRGRGGQGWYGDNSQVSVFEVPRPKASPDHPTVKPTGLIEPHLRNSCPPGGMVLDLFGGAGSTLASAEVTGHSARLLEIDPRYVDVCVQRWQDLTGKTAVREPATAAAEASDHARVPAGA